MRRHPYTILGGLLSILLACCNNHQESTLFTSLTNTGIDFANKVVNTDSANILNYRNFYNGGGVAIGDINNDGLPDVFLTANMGPNKLYLNEGNWHFRDISEKAGFSPAKQQWSTGVVMADVNGDGWLDIYVCNAGHMGNSTLRQNQLFINNHNNTFTDSAREYGLADSGYTTQASFFDYDGDGDLDCFLINNSPMVNTLDYVNQRQLTNLPATAPGSGDHLYRNDNGHFTEVTRQAGIHGSPISLGLGVTVGDINGDGLPDIYVSNDFFERDYLYINQGNGTFRDELEDRMQHISLASMGADLADVNNDGLPDLFTTDMLPDDDYRLKTTFSFENEDVYRLKQQAGFYHQFFQNTLQLNNKNGKFQEIACYAGINATDWSWGSLVFDMDNDGYNDIYVSNGIAQDLINQDFLDFFASNMAREMQASGKKVRLNTLLDKIPSHPILNKVFHNNGRLRFTDMAKEWGFNKAAFSNGAAYGDLDNDGDLDLIVNNVNQPLTVYRNNSREQNHNHYLAVSLAGTGMNRFAVGSRITGYRSNEILYRELIPARGFQSSMDYRQILGLGANPKVDSLLIQWPDGTKTSITNPHCDTLLTFHQPPSASKQISPGQPRPQNNPTLLTPIPSPFDRHQEDNYIDFYTEHNLPKMLSREGPKAAVADIDGDGRDDIYIAGTPAHPGSIYLQTAEGQFLKKPEPAFTPFADFEDAAVTFFDANGDGHPDLLLTPGGNIAAPYSRTLQLRLFLNDGKGNFHLDPDAFPANGNNSNISVAVPGDFNHDGHPDLFIGGGGISHEYGATPSSYIFINDGKGHFTDLAATKNPDISAIGMVTGAAWTNLTGDSTNQLVIVGAWMTPHIFTWRNQHFEEIKTNLSNLSGWWNCVAAADLDGDGRNDLILGNLGENFYLRPDSANPVKLWVGDFDGNGIADKILTRTIGGKDMPVFLKKDMEIQLPVLKKQNLKYSDYAGRAIQQLLPASTLDSATVRIFNFPASIIALNKGGGRYEILPLPVKTQFSSVNSILVRDIDGNNTPDLILGGNEFGFLPQFGRLDASLGQVLLNDRKAGWKEISPAASGLSLTGQIRAIALIRGKQHVYLLFLRNDDTPQLFRLP
jgi:hypothetical protein